MTLIYQRLVFMQTLKKTLLGLFTLYFLYGVIDYSLHMQEFAQVPYFITILRYYAFILSKRFDFLLSLSFLIATALTLIKMNTNFELIALQVAGIAKQKLLKPLFVLAILLCGLNLINYEWCAPYSKRSIDQFEKRYLLQNRQPENISSQLTCERFHDQSKFIYLKKNHKNNSYENVYWIENPKSIWHIKHLKVASKQPIGLYVDHFIRDETGVIIKEQSYEKHLFTNMSYEQGFLQSEEINFHNKSLSHVISLLPSSNHLEKTQAQTTLLYRLIIAFLPILTVMAISPYCIAFARYRSFYPIFAISIFFYIAFFIVLDALTILAANQLIQPLIILLGGSLSLYSYFFYRLKRCYEL